MVGLIGPNGAGKSTCFNLISGALEATSGSIKFMGHELIGETAAQSRSSASAAPSSTSSWCRP